jgi:GTP cyclohydrolase-4
MEQSNDESIHQHNAHAERVAEFGQLVDEMDGEVSE